MLYCKNNKTFGLIENLTRKGEKQMAKSYKDFPNVPGIITVRDRFYKHLFTMYTDNIRARIESVDTDHIKGQIKAYPTGWGDARVQVANNAGALVFDYVEMPNTDRNTLRTIAEAMDAESLSKVARGYLHVNYRFLGVDN